VSFNLLVMASLAVSLVRCCSRCHTSHTSSDAVFGITFLSLKLGHGVERLTQSYELYEPHPHKLEGGAPRWLRLLEITERTVCLGCLSSQCRNSLGGILRVDMLFTCVLLRSWDILPLMFPIPAMQV
jgi:hypothetical protein